MVRIHVVNSVKGGCGKSTWCLLLADYLRATGAQPYIIDLDIHGTSWYSEYEKYFEADKKSFVFINDLTEDVLKALGHRYIMQLKISREVPLPTGETTYNLPICVADPSRADSIHEEQLDIFEHVVFKIIEHIINNNESKEDGGYNKIDIILDMPPGYEPHAEKIINHLLFDINSPLTHFLKKRNDKISNQSHEAMEKRLEESPQIPIDVSKEDKINDWLHAEEYRIYFYMMSGIIYSGATLNAQYIKRLWNNQTYSNNTNEALPAENILFVLNDLTDQVVHLGDKNTFDNIIKMLEQTIKSELDSKPIQFAVLSYLTEISELERRIRRPSAEENSGAFELNASTLNEFKNRIASFFQPKD